MKSRERSKEYNKNRYSKAGGQREKGSSLSTLYLKKNYMYIGTKHEMNAPLQSSFYDFMNL